MLDGEHAQQHQVDHDRLADRRRDRVIYGSWHHYVADETDRIPEGNQEYQIARGPVNDRQITLHNLIRPQECAAGAFGPIGANQRFNSAMMCGMASRAATRPASRAASIW